jgi:DNA-binding Xre family transcriptional regulator
VSKRVYTIRLHVRAIAESKGITRTKLSRISDTNYNTINALWQEQAHDVMLLTLIKIAHALNVEVSELYTVTIDE